MKMVPYDKAKIGRISGERPGYIRDTIAAFLDGDDDCVKLEGYPQQKASTCAKSLNRCITRCRLFGVKAISHKGDVFLIKTDI